MSDLSEKLQQIEEAREALTKRVLGLPEETRHVPAVPGAFTPAETLEHMALTEAYYLPMFAKYQQSGKPPTPAKPNFIFRLVLKSIGGSKSVPSMKAMTPSEKRPDAEKAANHWAEVRAKTLAYLRGNDSTITVVRHPLFGRLSAEHIAQLHTLHTEYHARRI